MELGKLLIVVDVLLSPRCGRGAVAGAEPRHPGVPRPAAARHPRPRRLGQVHAHREVHRGLRGPRLDHPIPFIYIDFDRSTLSPTNPDSLLDEALKQIDAQFPGMVPKPSALAAAEPAARFQAVQGDLARSAHFVESRISARTYLVASTDSRPASAAARGKRDRRTSCSCSTRSRWCSGAAPRGLRRPAARGDAHRGRIAAARGHRRARRAAPVRLLVHRRDADVGAAAARGLRRLGRTRVPARPARPRTHGPAAGRHARARGQARAGQPARSAPRRRGAAARGARGRAGRAARPAPRRRARAGADPGHAPSPHRRAPAEPVAPAARRPRVDCPAHHGRAHPGGARARLRHRP